MQSCIVIQIANWINCLSSISRAQKDIRNHLGMTACAKDQNTSHSAHRSPELLSRRLPRLADPLTPQNLPDGQGDDLQVEPQR